MAPGRKRLQKIQIGRESTPGTAVAATKVWRGRGATIEDQSTVEEIEELVGVVDGTDRTAITALLAGLELAETPLTFEQFPILLVGGFGISITGSSDGAGTDKIYTATIPTTTVPTANTLTVETGDDAEAERMEYAVVTKISVKGTAGETAKVSASLMGRQVAANAFTGALTVPTVEDVITSRGKVYLDAIGGTYGTTQVASQILAFELNYELQWIPKFTLDGQLYYSFPHYSGHKISGKLTFEHDTAAKRSGGAKADFAAQTAKKLSIKLEGSTVATPGTTYSKKSVIFNLPIKYSKVGTIEDKDGNDIINMEFRSRYNATAADQGAIICVNESTTAL